MSLGTGCARLPTRLPATAECVTYCCPKAAAAATLRIRNVPAFTGIAYTQRVRVFRLIAGSNGISQHVKWSVYVSFSLVSVSVRVCVSLGASVRVAF